MTTKKETKSQKKIIEAQIKESIEDISIDSFLGVNDEFDNSTRDNILILISQNPFITRKQISDRLNITASTVSRIMNSDFFVKLQEEIKSLFKEKLARIQLAAMLEAEKLMVNPATKDGIKLGLIKFFLKEQVENENSDIDSPNELIFETYINESGTLESRTEFK